MVVRIGPFGTVGNFGHDWEMSVIRINAIEVAEGKGPELARRFAGRAHAVDSADGFEGFELLEPTDGRRTWLVVTRWKDEEAFRKWVASPAFGHGHRGHDAESGGETAPLGEPVTVTSELWSYQAVDLDQPSQGPGGSLT